MKTQLRPQRAAAATLPSSLDDSLRQAFPGCPVLIHAIIDDPKNAALKAELATQLVKGKSGRVTQQQLTEALLNHLPSVGRLFSNAAALGGSLPGRGAEGGAMSAVLTMLHDLLNKEIHLFELNSPQPQGGIDHNPDSGLMSSSYGHKFSEAAWNSSYGPFVREDGLIPATSWMTRQQVSKILDDVSEDAPGSRAKAGAILPMEHGIIAQLFGQEIGGERVVVASELKAYLLDGTVPERLLQEQGHQVAQAFALVAPTVLPSVSGLVQGAAKDIWRMVTFQGSGDAVKGAQLALESIKNDSTLGRGDATGQAMRGAGGAVCPFMRAMQAAGPGASAVNAAHHTEVKKWAREIGGASAAALLGAALVFVPGVGSTLSDLALGHDLYGTPLMTFLLQAIGGAGAGLAALRGIEILKHERPERGQEVV